MNENKTSRVAFKRRAVWIDGVETRILAGTMHYFRQPREYWRERMEKAAAMGLNAIETYLRTVPKSVPDARLMAQKSVINA